MYKFWSAMIFVLVYLYSQAWRVTFDLGLGYRLPAPFTAMVVETHSESLTASGSTNIDSVTRAARSSQFQSMFSSIHDVSDPHTITRRSYPAILQRFQNWANALKKSDSRLQNQGNSSMKMMAFPWGLFGASMADTTLYMRLKASLHVVGDSALLSPHFVSSHPNCLSCSRVVSRFDPTT